MGSKKNKTDKGVQIKGAENFKEAEWVFQFDNDDPVVFAWSNEASDDNEEPAEVNIKIKAESNSSIAFASPNGDKIFRMYSRPITDGTKKLRDSSKK